MGGVLLLRDQNFLIVQDTYGEKAFRGVYDGSNNLIYAGFAIIGSSVAEAVWQIKKLGYDGTNLISVTWPQINGKASREYSFIWNDYASYTYS